MSKTSIISPISIRVIIFSHFISFFLMLIEHFCTLHIKDCLKNLQDSHLLGLHKASLIVPLPLLFSSVILPIEILPTFLKILT